MFAKIFSSIYESSIAEDHTIRHVFMDLLVLADEDGAVDMTLTAVARRTNVPIEIVSRAIGCLESPDPQSRTATHGGRRLLPITEGRGWGWKIVNYAKYRAVQQKEVRREYFREQKKQQRARPTSPEAKALASLFHRSEGDCWSPAEIEAFKEAKPALESVRLVCAYTEAERRKGEDGRDRGIHKRSLLALLNQWQDQIDRAKTWAKQNPRKAARVLQVDRPAQIEEAEPEGFRKWLSEIYPKADQGMRWKDVPPGIKAEYKIQ